MIQPSTRRSILFGLLVVGLYGFAFPYFPSLLSANEMPRLLLTEEIVDHHKFAIDDRLAEMGSRYDVSNTPDGHHYSNKAPGISFLAIPSYLMLKLWYAIVGGAPSLGVVLWWFRATGVTLPSLLFLGIFWRTLPLFAAGAGPRRAAFLAYAFGSMAFPYALLFMSHVPAAACAGAAFAIAIGLSRNELRRPKVGAALCGCLTAASVLMDYQAVFAAGLLGLYVIWASRNRLRDVSFAILGALPPGLLLAVYNDVCFGAPWKTGYSFVVDPSFNVGVMGIQGPNLQAFWTALLQPNNGLLIFTPWVLLAVVGAVAVARDPTARHRIGKEALLCGAVAIAYVLFLGSLEPRLAKSGWTVGPRYMVVALPFFGWLAAVGLQAIDEVFSARTLGYALILVGVIVHVVAATTFPHWPDEFRNPLYEVSFRLIGERWLPPSLGSALGLPAWLSIWLFYGAVGAFAIYLLAWKSKERALSTAAAGVIAIGIIVAYGSFPATGPFGERSYAYIKSTWSPPYR